MFKIAMFLILMMLTSGIGSSQVVVPTSPDEPGIDLPIPQCYPCPDPPPACHWELAWITVEIDIGFGIKIAIPLPMTFIVCPIPVQ